MVFRVLQTNSVGEIGCDVNDHVTKGSRNTNDPCAAVT